MKILKVSNPFWNRGLEKSKTAILFQVFLVYMHYTHMQNPLIWDCEASDESGKVDVGVNEEKW